MELATLIGSGNWQKLQNCYESETAFHGRAEVPKEIIKLWSEWELDALLEFGALPDADSIRIMMQGTRVNPQLYRSRSLLLASDALRQLKKSGVTLNILRAEDYSNKFLDLSRSLEQRFNCPVQVNLYSTPGNQQGLGGHYDKHDILILQLRGQKRWVFREPLESHLRLGQKSESNDSLTVYLTEGDWMFVPRGQWHEVRNHQASSSVHLAIGFHPLTWGAVFSKALELANDRLPAWWDKVDLAFDGKSAVEIERRFRDFISLVNLEDQLGSHEKRFRNLAMAVPTAESFNGDDRTKSQETCFQWVTDSVERKKKGGLIELDLSYRRAPLALRPELGEVLAEMKYLGRFDSRNLAAGIPESNQLLCQFLANVGVLKTTSGDTVSAEIMA